MCYIPTRVTDMLSEMSCKHCVFCELHVVVVIVVFDLWTTLFWSHLCYCYILWCLTVKSLILLIFTLLFLRRNPVGLMYCLPYADRPHGVYNMSNAKNNQILRLVMLITRCLFWATFAFVASIAKLIECPILLTASCLSQLCSRIPVFRHCFNSCAMFPSSEVSLKINILGWNNAVFEVWWLEMAAISWTVMLLNTRKQQCVYHLPYM